MDAENDNEFTYAVDSMTPMSIGPKMLSRLENCFVPLLLRVGNPDGTDIFARVVVKMTVQNALYSWRCRPRKGKWGISMMRPRASMYGKISDQVIARSS
jgi:hypothetical protein